MRKCVLMLPAIERERVWEKKGFSSLAEYAGRLSGMSRGTVSDGLRILRTVENMPDIMKVIEDKGIAIVRPILTLLTDGNQKFWADKMRAMSQHTLEMYRREWEREQVTGMTIRATMTDSATDTELDIFGRRAPEERGIVPQPQAIEAETIEVTKSASGDEMLREMPREATSQGETFPSLNKVIGMELSPLTIDRLTKLKGDDEWDTLMNELLDIREKMLEQNRPEEKQTESRHIPIEMKRFVIERSRGVCEMGVCAKRYAILHHTQRFASEKTHDPSRIVALCKQHERLVHLGLIHDETIAPKQWKMLQEPDKNDPKYQIDRLVQRYRRPG